VKIIGLKLCGTLRNCSLFMTVRNIYSSNTDDGCGNRINQSRKFVSTFRSLLFFFIVHSFVCIYICVCVLLYFHVLSYSFMVCACVRAGVKSAFIPLLHKTRM
jgi:hypothetical protein